MSIAMYRASSVCLAAGFGASLIALRSRTLALHHATTDPVTDLPTRARWSTTASRALRAHGGEIAMLDLRSFKDINDTHGHPTGDALLRTVGRRLHHSLTPSGSCCRWGGDEFVLHSPGSLDPDLILDELAAPLRLHTGRGHLDLTLHASLGIAPARPGRSLDELLDAADDAMYAARLLGRRWSTAA